MKRIILFLLTNLAIIVVLGIVLRLLGVDSLFEQGGVLNYTNLLIFAFVFGMGGSFISLLISKWMAKMSTGAQVIQNPSNPTERWLIDTVRRLSKQAGIGMPEVAIYDSPDVNAFATGANKNNALVAVSTGLLANMTEDEIEAVLGHEIAHIANGDMVTLTLIQGVVNTFVIFISRVIGHIVDRVILKHEGDGPGLGYFITSIIAEIFLGILASIIVMWFSRQREFRADAGGARLTSPQKMANALRRLQAIYQPEMAAAMPPQMKSMGISGQQGGGLARLFMTHPPLEERIASLESGAYARLRG
jgi:heat shock protein HtpX